MRFEFSYGPSSGLPPYGLKVGTPWEENSDSKELVIRMWGTSSGLVRYNYFTLKSRLLFFLKVA